MATIVVGVDGSESAQEALRLAIQGARLRGAGLRVVTAWHMSALTYGGGGFTPDIDPAVFQGSANEALEATLAALGEQANGVASHMVSTLRMAALSPWRPCSCGAYMSSGRRPGAATSSARGS